MVRNATHAGWGSPSTKAMKQNPGCRKNRIRALDKRRKTPLSNSAPDQIIERNGKEQEKPDSPHVGKPLQTRKRAEQQIGGNHHERERELHPCLLERAQRLAVDRCLAAADVHLVACGAGHVDALAPRHVHALLAIVHVDAVKTDADFRSPLLRRPARLARRESASGLPCRALGGSVGRLERHIVFDVGAHVQKLIERHAVKLGERDEVVRVGR